MLYFCAEGLIGVCYHHIIQSSNHPIMFHIFMYAVQMMSICALNPRMVLWYYFMVWYGMVWYGIALVLSLHLRRGTAIALRGQTDAVFLCRGTDSGSVIIIQLFL